METNQQTVPMSEEQVLLEILQNSRKTKRYMQWQLYITIALVVLPLLAMAIMLPILMKSLGTLSGVYGGALQ